MSEAARPRCNHTLHRRQLLLGGVAGLGVAGIARVVDATTPELDSTATASETAVRVPPPTTTIPLADGEILFPIVAVDGDDVFVLDSFGDPRGCCRSHEAVDIMADQGLPLQAVADGVLTKKYVDSGLTFGAGHGWTLIDPENGVVYKYFHMAAHADGLEEGDEVAQGQVIGYVGETGTTGAGSAIDNFHCHFEYRPNNIARDPFHLLQRAPHVRFQGE